MLLNKKGFTLIESLLAMIALLTILTTLLKPIIQSYQLEHALTDSFEQNRILFEEEMLRLYETLYQTRIHAIGITYHINSSEYSIHNNSIYTENTFKSEK